MNEFLILVGVPVVRSVAGWLENALADGKISFIEWKKLFKTVLKIGVPGFFLYYGLAWNIELAATIPLLVDYAFNWFGKMLKKANGKK